MRRLALAATLVVLSFVGASAATVPYEALSTSGPWNPALNSGLQYGSTFPGQGPSAPLTITGFDFSVGVTISNVQGLTSPYGDVPYANADGDPTFPTGSTPSSSGERVPAYYLPGGDNTYLNSLMGAFALNGVVVGDVFVIGTAGGLFTPSGTVNQLLVGFNDDIYNDNTGSITFDVTGNAIASPVPEPSTWAMMILGFAGVGFLAYRRRDQTASLRVA